MEFTTLAEFALNLDRTSHNINNTFRDRHAESGSHDLVHLFTILPFKGIKYLLLELL